MKRIYHSLFFVFLILSGAIQPAHAQRSNGLTVEGTVSVEKGTVDGAVIQMIRDDRPFGNYGIGNTGQYKVELNYNHEFILIFSRPGNFSQKIIVDTRVPRQVLQSDPLFPPFPVNVKLFTEISRIDRTFSENTVMKIYYSSNVDNFIADVYYNEAQIKHLIDQAILQAQQIGREADYLEGLTRAELAELRKEYDQLIREAEDEYRKEEFLKALDGYQAAGKIFPGEQYPKDRIAEINDLLGILMVATERQQALAERLNELIAQADELFTLQKYQEARNAYHRALSVDPGNRHSQDRVTEISEILYEQQVDREYQKLIVQADNSFKELLYVGARKTFEQALQLKENEPYPKQRIDEIDKILNQQALQSEKLKSYEESIFLAEVNFSKQFYEKAISFYESALAHKPGDEVAASKIEEIRALMNELANRTMYEKLIKSADRSFQRKQYHDALAEYDHAAKLLPGEEYPQTQMNRIHEIFAEAARLAAEAEAEALRLAAEAEAAEQARLAAIEAERDRRYARAVAAGDSLFLLDAYEDSRTLYLSALEVKPDESYPQQRVEEINGVLEERARIDSEYYNKILLADSHFNAGEYEQAGEHYEQALEIKPAEDYPVDQLAKISNLQRQQQERLLAEKRDADEMERRRVEIETRQNALSMRQEMSETELNRIYDEYISLADGFFDNQRYNVSRAWYYKAWDVKPQENYPSQRINEINRIVGSMLLDQRDRDYQNFVNLADSSFRVNQLAVARGWYNRALSVKSNENYPREQLQAISNLIAERMAGRSGEQFASHIKNAGEAFESGSYNVARFWYKKALELRPDDEQAKDGLNKINDALK